MGLRGEPASGGARFGCMGLLDRGRRLLLGSSRSMGLIDFARGGGAASGGAPAA